MSKDSILFRVKNETYALPFFHVLCRRNVHGGAQMRGTVRGDTGT